jgi:PAS domain S-box-containing protein
MQGVIVDDPGKTVEQLVSELAQLRQRIAELEASESRHETAGITERERAEGEILQRAQLSALGAAVGLALIHSDSLAGGLQQCAEALVTFMGAAFARIWTLNEREGVLELQASAGLYTHVNGAHGRVPLGQFKIGRIAQDRKPHLTNAVIGDPEVSDQDWARREGMLAFAGHPLIVDGRRVVGVMALFARHALSDTVISEMASVADHIALGIERHRSTEALRTAEERMRFALEAAGVGTWDMDYSTGMLRWSAILESQYGLKPGTFGGTFEAFAERIHPDDRESVIETVGKAMKAGADFSTQHRTLWPDGTVRWLSGAGRIHLGEHGEPVRGVGISQDVTERKRAEVALGQSETRKAAVLDSVLDCIVTMNADGVVLEFNAAAERTFGYTKAEAIGRALADLIIPPPLRDAHTAGLAHYRATGEGPLIGKLIEVTAVRSDGSEIPVELTITAIRSDKAPIFTGVMRDITSRKKGETELKRLNDEIQLQRLRVFKATMRTVQDIVNNLLNGLRLVHLEAEGHVPAEMLELVDRTIQEAAVKLKALGDLETVTEKEMGLGPGIDYPGSTS